MNIRKHMDEQHSWRFTQAEDDDYIEMLHTHDHTTNCYEHVLEESDESNSK